MEPHASTLVTFGIPLLSLLVLAAIALAIHHVTPGEPHARRLALAALTWLGVSAALAEIGLLARFDLRPPPFLLIVLPTFGLPLWLALSPLGARLARDLPLTWLVVFQGFRLPLELVMHVAAREGVMPEQMTFTGHNFDIVTGTSALLVGALIALDRAPRALVLLWNVLGSLLLVVIIAVAMSSLPQFHAYGADPAHVNTWVAYFPFVWLPAALVSSAFLGHAVLWRRLLTEGRTHALAPSAVPARKAI